jgi:uncharacterized protein YndB with AHSA1/START domain
MSYEMKVERLIDATPENVFDAFIDGDAIKDWYRLDPNWETSVEACDARVGGRTRVFFGGDEKYREDITYEVLERPHRIVYEEQMRRVEHEGTEATRVTVTFDAQDGKTLVTLVQSGFAQKERRDMHEQGWPQFLARLDEVLASRR